jgi:polysaccharide deacetylase 2 family uncharacterized protein YibQ
MDNDPKPLAQKIKDFGDNSEKVLESIESATSKIAKKAGAVLIGFAIAITVGYSATKEAISKVAPILEKQEIEVVEEKNGSKVFRVKGANSPEPDK